MAAHPLGIRLRVGVGWLASYLLIAVSLVLWFAVPETQQLHPAAQVLAIAADRENLCASGSRGREREVSPVRGVRGTFIRALSEGNLSRLVGRDVIDLDVVARTGSPRVCDLVECRRPRRLIRP